MRAFLMIVMIVPTLRVGMQPRTLRVPKLDAERHKRHFHAERGNERIKKPRF